MAAELLRVVSSFEPAQCSTENQRLEIISVMQTLLTKIRTPTERMVEMTACVPVQNIVIRMLLDMKLFEKWQQTGNGPKTVQELALLANIEPNLLRRLLVFMVSQNFLDQIDENTFAFSTATASLAEPTAYSWSSFFYDLIFPLVEGMPSYFRRFGYRPPTDPSNGIYQHALNQPGKNLFQVFASRPEFAAHFHVVMTEWGKHRTYWLDFYPSHQLLDNGQNPLIVDIAGGVGHDLERFNSRHPGYMDRMVLAEKPEVASRAICNKAIKVIEHDFFTPMLIHGLSIPVPVACDSGIAVLMVSGSRVYYFKEIFHNWTDENATRILQNIKPAMTPGYSMILINDIVMPPIDPDGFGTMMDLLMMALPGGLERTESQWRKLVEAAGLRIVKIWSSPTAKESIIEIKLPADGNQ